MTYKRRVVIVGPATSRLGGIAAGLRRHFQSWDSNRFEYRHVATSVEGNKFKKGVVLLVAIVKFLATSITWKPQIVHVHFSSLNSFYRQSIFVILAYVLNIPVLFHCHSGRFNEFYESSGRLKLQFIDTVLKSVDTLAVVASSWLDYFEEICPSTKKVIVYNPVYVPKSIERKENLPPVVLSLGRLGVFKGTYDILEAVPLVVDEIPGVQFNMAGDGEIAEVKNLMKNVQWRDNVKLMGWVGGEAKESAYLGATIFLHPSYHEGLPLAILEAMAYGLPIVTTPVGGIPDAVEDGVSGIIIEPGDVNAIAQSVNKLLTHTELARELGKSARQVAVKKFEVHHVLESLYNVYDSIIESNYEFENVAKV